MELKTSMAEKFIKVSGIDFEKLAAVQSKIELATFSKFSVSDELNTKLLAVQGFNHKYVKLATNREIDSGKVKKSDTLGKVFLFVIRNNKIVKFYDCFVVSASDKKPVVLKEQKTEISVMPLNVNNSRVAEVKKNDVMPLNLDSKPKDDELTKLKDEMSNLNAKFDYLVEAINKLQK